MGVEVERGGWSGRMSGGNHEYIIFPNNTGNDEIPRG